MIAALLGATALTLGTASTAEAQPSGPRASRRAWLGIELARAPGGAVVARHVSRTSPAEQAGVRDGDGILAVDGRPVDTPRAVVARVAELGPDQRLTLTIRRGGATRELSVVLAPHPGDEEVVRRDRVGTFAPSWGALTPVSGVLPTSLAAARGRVVIVDFWATWCGPCKLIAPTLSGLSDRFGAQGLTVVGISGDRPEDAARAARAQGLRYATGTETAGEASIAYGVRAIPTMFVIDKQGVVRDVKIGFHPRHAAELEKLVVTLLAEPGPPGAPPGSAPPRGPAPPPGSAPKAADPPAHAGPPTDPPAR